MVQQSQNNNYTSIDMKRAQTARKFVMDYKKTESNQNALKEFRSYCRNNPSTILYNGLSNTIAFYKSKDSYGKLVDALSSWAKTFLGKESADFDLESYIINEQNLFSVAYLTEELIAYSIWLKRFAEIHIEEKKQVDSVDKTEKQNPNKSD